MTAGSSAHVAATKVRQKALAVAGHLLEAAPSDLDISGQYVHLKGAAELKVGLGEVARASLGVAGAYLPAGLPPGMEASEAFVVNEMAYSNGTAVAIVEVDVETGGMKILDYVMAHDCGQVINPAIVDGQVAGGIVHGIGNALLERMHFDASAQPLTTTLAALAVANEQERTHAGFDDLAWFLVRSEVMSVVVGLILGAIGGAVITWSRQRGWMSDTWAQLSMLTGALLCFEVGGQLDGSGLVAAFAGGLGFAFVAKRTGGRPDTHVSDAAAHLLELVIFAMFGAYAVVEAWRDVGWRVVAFAFVAVFGVRLIAVMVALVRTDLPTKDRLFIGWFGPRGLGTMVLGLIMIEHSDEHLEYWITQAVGVTVSLSLLVHSLTVWPGINWLATKEPVEVGKIGSSPS